MTLATIFKHLESISPLAFQEDYDNCGLITGAQEWPFRKALLCLDVTSEVMDEAIRKQCNVIISHHPFIFRGLKKLTIDQPETEILTKAIKNDIAIYAIHTNLDNTLHGLNALLLKKLGISNYRILSPKEGVFVKLATFCPVDHAENVRNALFSAGAGHIGNYDCCSYNTLGEGTFRASDSANPFVGEKNSIHFEKEIRIEVIFPEYLKSRIIKQLIDCHPYEEVAYDIYPLKNPSATVGSGLIGTLDNPWDESVFLESLKFTFDIPFIRHSATRSGLIRKVAVCSGSGSFLIPDAIKAGADIFLTADLKYHDFFNLRQSLIVADIGHYESEHWVKEWLHAVLIEKFPNFAFLISEVNTNPVHYL